MEAAEAWNSRSSSATGEEIKPCPFCGSTNLRVMGGIGKYVKCRDCEASSGHLPGGSCSADEGAAVEAWNARWERTCHMQYVSLYDEECVDGIECDECGWTEIHDTDDPVPARCPGCGSKVVA